MKKASFNNPNIEEHNIDPLSHAILKQNVRLKRENAQLKKEQNMYENTELVVGDLHIDKITHEVYYNDIELVLSSREYELLLFFCENTDRIVTFEDIGNELFGSYSENDKQSIMVNVSRLRKKMPANTPLENLIENVRGKGYKITSR